MRYSTRRDYRGRSDKKAAPGDLIPTYERIFLETYRYEIQYTGLYCPEEVAEDDTAAFNVASNPARLVGFGICLRLIKNVGV